MKGIDRRQFIKYCSGAAAALTVANTQSFADTPRESEQSDAGILKIDSFSHFAFPRAMEFLEKHEGRPHPFTRLFANTPTLKDIDLRVEQMERNGIKQNVLVPLPWLEMTPKVYNDKKLVREAAKIVNDAMAEAVSRHPDRFYPVALLPTLDSTDMMDEYERTVEKMGFVGSLIAIGPTAKYPVDPDYEPLYKASEKDNAPIWLHPSRPPTMPDFPGRKMSEYNIFQAFSWLLDTSSAMTHIALKGTFVRYPDVKIITHHHGALIPLFSDRLLEGIKFFEQNTGRKADIRVDDPVQHLKKFYVDTAVQGIDSSKLKSAIAFYGADRCLFGTDCPMDVKSGEIFVQGAVKSLDALKLSRNDLEKIYAKNFLRIIRRDTSQS